MSWRYFFDNFPKNFSKNAHIASILSSAAKKIAEYQNKCKNVSCKTENYLMKTVVDIASRTLQFCTCYFRQIEFWFIFTVTRKKRNTHFDVSILKETYFLFVSCRLALVRWAKSITSYNLDYKWIDISPIECPWIVGEKTQF